MGWWDAERVSSDLYRGHRFPREIISECVWHYFRFGVSFRDVEEPMAARGMLASYETIRIVLDILVQPKQDRFAAIRFFS